MDKHAFLSQAEIATVAEMYEMYLQNPESVEESWRNFFRGFEFAQENYAVKKGSAPAPQSDGEKRSIRISTTSQVGFANEELTPPEQNIEKEFRVINLIDGYRRRGHLFTKTNPVRRRRQYFPTLEAQNFGLDNSDMELPFQAAKLLGFETAVPLKDIIGHLEQTYCQSIGVEFIYVRKPEVVEWLQDKMETVRNTPVFTEEEKKDIYFHLKQTVGFEQFIHRKFIGQKRFSLEGAESLIPALDAAIEHGVDLGIKEFIIGMPHRGRLNVLANILQKPYEKIFNEFIGEDYDESVMLGDVKYHLGYGQTVITDTGQQVQLNLLPNPSHLETVGSVVQGIARAKINRQYENDFSRLAPIVIHGDAAIAAQGIVYETIQMANLNGYRTGGTIHIVINNQVGFTTDYLDARSSTYCTDIAKVNRSPVFHVNGDDVEALVYTIKLAMDYRQKFQRDVFIDLLCYRRYGHNEGDEPRFTQPLLYDAIAKHPNTRDIYGKKLIEDSIYTQKDLKNAESEFNHLLEQKFEKAQTLGKVHIKRFLLEDWKKFRRAEANDFRQSIETGVSNEQLQAVADKITTLPENARFFKKIDKLIKDRRKMLENNRLDWGMAELLAYGTLVTEGCPVRISGQDAERGTFSHRHAAYVYKDSTEKYFPLKHIAPQQASFHIYNSLLSEYGALGFEYGYAMAMPEGLTVWEAQFGDFHNVAQAVIDQYISSGEEKWGVMNGVVMYLPHGFEGQGPEHSSARIERFLSMAANDNMLITNCTTPANFFHVLRRQVKNDFRKPLVIFTPKSLLRHPKCVSPLDDLATGNFKEVIDDQNVDEENISRLVFCSGKIYYDLLARKEELNATDVALVRIEQLHPFPLRQLVKIVRKYKKAKLMLWVQEEPENMGAWRYIQNEFRGVDLELVARRPSGSPASGLYHLHLQQQKEIINKVFRFCDCELNNKYCALQCVEGRSREEITSQYRYLFEETGKENAKK